MATYAAASSRLIRPSRSLQPGPFTERACASLAERQVLSSMMHHDAADRLPVRRRLKFRGNPATRHDADTIGEIEHLVKVVADQYDCRSAGARFEQPLMHRRAGSNVETPAWTVRNDDFGITGEFARNDQLLRVAAGKERALSDASCERPERRIR